VGRATGRGISDGRSASAATSVEGGGAITAIIGEEPDKVRKPAARLPDGAMRDWARRGEAPENSTSASSNIATGDALRVFSTRRTRAGSCAMSTSARTGVYRLKWGGRDCSNTRAIGDAEAAARSRRRPARSRGRRLSPSTED